MQDYNTKTTRPKAFSSVFEMRCEEEEEEEELLWIKHVSSAES
jgi:hypothetical protein